MADITDNAMKILRARYFRKDLDGNIIEDWPGLCKRVSDFVAQADPGSAERWSKTYYELMHSLTFLPNSPTLFNADMPLGNLSGCFVLPVGDSLEEIFAAISNAALIFATGGGCGYDFSALRKRGSPVSRTSGVSSGPVSFIQVFHAATEVIKQGGKRRGANMGVLRIDHPDIEEFLDSKRVEGSLSNFNLSVAITDEFMQAVEADENFALFDNHTGKVDREVKAKDLFDKIVASSWSNGEPGVIFIDEINRKHPLKGMGEITSTNPCVSKGTLISTSEGLIPIESVKEGDLVLTRDGKFASVLRQINNGVKRVIELKTRRGFRIKVTPDHNMWTSEDWVSADQCLNRPLVLQRAAAFGTQSMHEDLAELFGFWFGDGSAGERVQFAFGHDEFLACKYRDILNSQFACKVNVTIGRGNNLIPNLRAVTGKRNVVEFFGKHKYKKAIPDEILGGKRVVQAAFLRGLFAADGHIERAGGMSAIALSCVHEAIVDQVRLMLLNFGIVCNKYRTEKGPALDNIYNIKGDIVCYRIQFAGQFREIFINEIGTYKQVQPTKTYHLDDETDAVVSIDEVGECEVYDLTVDDESHSFVANGLAVSNCSEQPLLPNESCNLGSINLTKFFKEKLSSAEASDYTHDYQRNIDWAGLASVVKTSVRFLDDVVTVNKYPVQEIAEQSAKTRKIGLGVMGYADLLLMLQMNYNSDRAIHFATQLMEWIQYYAKTASIDLAAERGSFPAYEEHYEPVPRFESRWEGILDWDELDREMHSKGLRNACITTVAPTGTLSLIAGVSGGIEPNFQWEYTYNRIDEEFTEVHWLARNFLNIDEPLPSYFVTSLDFKPYYHIKMQAAFQLWVDSGISKTINLPFEATREDVASAIILAWKSKTKGITSYRSGSRAKEVLVRKDSRPAAVTAEVTPRERPIITTGSTMKVAVGDNCGSMFVTMNLDGVGPCESFIALGRGGGCISSHTEALGRIISLALRSGIDPVKIIDQLRGIRCSKPRWLEGGDIIRSCPDAVAFVFSRLLSLDDNDESAVKDSSAVASGENPECPECHGELMVEAHCLSCRSCGYSKCG